MLKLNRNSLIIVHDSECLKYLHTLNNNIKIHKISDILDIFEESGFLDFYERENYIINFAKTCFINAKGLYIFFEDKNYKLINKLVKWTTKIKIPVFHLYSSKMTEKLEGTKININHTDIKIIKDDNFNFEDKGITVIGDVHGNITALQSAVNWALSRRNHIIFLGDIVDHGNNNIQTVFTVYNLVMSGDATLIIGNHDRKILKYINNIYHGEKVYLTDNNKKTVDEINSLGDIEREEFYIKYKALINKSRTHLYLDNLIFVHAGWSTDMNKYKNQKYLPKYLEDIALTGEKKSSSWKITYNWVSKVPKDVMVFIGHDTIDSIKPTILENDNGGKVFKMDIGCGSGGLLASCDLKKINGLWKVENFNVHS